MPLWSVIYAVGPWSVAAFVGALVALVVAFAVWAWRSRRRARVAAGRRGGGCWRWCSG